MVLEPPEFEGSFPVPEFEAQVMENEKKQKDKVIILYCFAQKNLLCKSVAPVVSSVAQE
jgi:thiol-disulfide isomerase/thioredoxin